MKTICIVILALSLAGCGHQDFHRAKVISKTFVPSSTQVGYTAAGKGGVVVTSEPEKYVIVLQFEDGAVDSTEVTAAEWAQFHEAQEVEVDCRWWGYNAVRVAK